MNLEKILRFGKKIIPTKLFRALQPFYHRLLSLAGAIVYSFPSRHLRVVGVTGTKGKSTTVEMLNAILEESGQKTAVLGTIRFKIGDDEVRNLYKMTMPGRFFVQKFLRKAVRAGCETAILEMTSEGAKQFRHKHIDLDALIFTNLSPEHIESHGSYEAYRDAKLSIAKTLEKPWKKTAIVVNKDDSEADRFLKLRIRDKIEYSLSDGKPFSDDPEKTFFSWRGQKINLKTPGRFNIYNALGAAAYADHVGIGVKTIKKALENFDGAKGRVQYVKVSSGQQFDVVVDYAHTPDSLKKFYEVFKSKQNICVLGNTGGGRDKWKRGEMAKIAEANCIEVILTNEDPYDEDPERIVDEMYKAMEDKIKAHIIMNRREAIREAIRKASLLSGNEEKNVAVLITGKGTDPYIMISGGRKIPWDDATVVREELKEVLEG